MCTNNIRSKSFESKLDPFFGNFTSEKPYRQKEKAAYDELMALPELDRKNLWGRLKSRLHYGHPLESGEYQFVREMERQVGMQRRAVALARWEKRREGKAKEVSEH